MITRPAGIGAVAAIAYIYSSVAALCQLILTTVAAYRPLCLISDYGLSQDLKSREKNVPNIFYLFGFRMTADKEGSKENESRTWQL